MDLTDWDAPDPGYVVTPASNAEWDLLARRYRGSLNDLPFDRCLKVARDLGARTVVVETRWDDPDYSSEYRAYYCWVFQDVPRHTHRLHFLAADNLSGVRPSDLPTDPGYIGYVSVRPVSEGSVSRAMLPPPPDVPGVRCAAQEEVHLFGRRYTVSGVPFAQQDTGLGACAHAAAWMCHRTAYLKGDVADRSRADFALHSDPSLSPHRALPSTGLTVHQLSDLLRRFDLPATFYTLGSLPSPRLPWQAPDPVPPTPGAPGGAWDTRVFAVLCRYLNGGRPVLVGTRDHAFVVLGWSRDPTNGKIRFVRHDDQRGPYLPVDNPLDDKLVLPNGSIHQYGPWNTLQAPAPPTLWQTPEPAELRAGLLIVAVSRRLALRSAATGTALEGLDDLITDARLALRTYACDGNAFKERAAGLGMDPTHVSGYAEARLPKQVWVVEAVDRDLRTAGLPCVLGEVLVDATSSDHNPYAVAVRVHGVLTIMATAERTQGPFHGSASPTTSGGSGDP